MKYSLENGAGPNTDASEIVATFVAVPVGDVHHAVPFDGHVLPEMSLAQGQRDIVTGAVVLVDQRLQIDVGQNVAAVGNKQLFREKALDVFDPATRSENFRLVN